VEIEKKRARVKMQIVSLAKKLISREEKKLTDQEPRGCSADIEMYKEGADKK